MMTFDSITNTFDTTLLDDDPIASGTYVTSSHLKGTHSSTRCHLPNILICGIRSHTSGEPTATMDNHPTPDEYPHLDIGQLITTTPSHPDLDDHHSECRPSTRSKRHIHNSHQRVPRAHNHRGPQRLSGGSHTDSPSTPICSRT